MKKNVTGSLKINFLIRQNCNFLRILKLLPHFFQLKSSAIVGTIFENWLWFISLFTVLLKRMKTFDEFCFKLALLKTY